jgi:hypothetical protein
VGLSTCTSRRKLDLNMHNLDGKPKLSLIFGSRWFMQDTIPPSVEVEEVVHANLIEEWSMWNFLHVQI